MSMSLTYSQANPIVYSDVNYNYTNTAYENVPIVYNLSAIKVKIMNVLFTTIGSRHFEPQFGSRFPELPFKNLNPQEAYKYLIEIEAAMAKWLPIITLDRTRSFIYASDAMQAFILKLLFYVEGIQQPQNLTLTY